MAFFCVKCGKVLETSDKFCKYCGTPVAYNNNGSAYGKDTIPASLKKTDDSLNSTDSNTSSSSTYKKSDQNYNTGNRTAQQSSIDRILTFIIEMIKNLGRFLWKTTKEHIIPRLKSLCGFWVKLLKKDFSRGLRL